jgi:hypothetical protein
MSVSEPMLATHDRRSINPWLLVVGSGLGLMLLVALGLAGLAMFGPPQTLRDNEQRMPDGTVLRVEAVTWGTSHRVNLERPPSAPWAFWESRRTSISHGTGQPELMVWLSRHDARTGKSLDFDWWSGNTAIDALGASFSDRGAFHRQLGQHGSSFSGGNRPFRADHGRFDHWIVSSSFAVFRTDDQGKFKLQVRNTSDEVVATFDVKHPSPPAIQTWTAEELPVTVEQGELAVTLHGLKPSAYWTTYDGVKRKRWHFHSAATLAENGSPSSQWSVFLFDITDPLGNRWQHSGGNFSAREPVWKVTLGAFRSTTSQFTPAETWTLPELPLPDKDAAKPLTEARSFDGVSVTVASIAGAGKLNYSLATPGLRKYGNVSTSRSGNWTFSTPASLEIKGTGSAANVKVEAQWPHLALEVTGMTPLHRLYVTAKDDQGRDVPTQQASFYGELQSYFFQTEPDAKSLTPTIVVHKAHEFEFFIKPPELPDDTPLP